MLKPTDEQLKNFSILARQYPEFVEFLTDWRDKELNALPYSKNENLDVLRGRIQALTELQRFLESR